MSDATAAEATDREYPPLHRNPDFVRFLSGQFVSNAGDSLYTVAVMWLVFELSGSTVLTGVANALLLLPYLLQIIAGPVVDRLPVKPVLVAAQVAQGVVVLVFPLAASAGALSVELILATVPVLALLTLVVSPIRSTLLPRIVAEGQLSRGNSALATVTLGLDMVFDALGGLFIAAFGATTLFLLDSVTFAVATLLFVGMAVPAVDGGTDDGTSAVGSYVADLREGIDVLRGTVLVDMLFTAAVFNFAVGVTLAILPAFGDRIGGAAAYGFLLGGLGVGRMVGSVVAPRVRGVAYGRLKIGAYLLSTLVWLAAVASGSPALTVGLFGLAWVTAGADDVLTETLNQTVFPAELLGRISAIKGTASTATLPVGSLVGGVVAEQLGVVPTMGLAASGFGFVGLYFAVHGALRRLPPVAGMDPSTFALGLERTDDA